MPTPVFLLLLVLILGSAGIIIVNLTGDPGIDYWDLDGENELPSPGSTCSARSRFSMARVSC